MLEEFDKYVKSYDLNDEFIRSKYNHSYRVMELSKKYAKMLNFNDKDIELAGIIGLLHDIGRFEQFKRYHSFNDIETIDHADYGVKELFDNNKIKLFTDKEKEYDIIKYAIYNHNKYQIDYDPDIRKLKHAKLIRDVDKIDIMFIMSNSGLDIKVSADNISLEVIDNIKNKTSVNSKFCRNSNDIIVRNLALAFDINNDVCLEEMKRNLGYYYNQIEDKSIFKEIYEEVIKYIDDRINGN